MSSESWQLRCAELKQRGAYLYHSKLWSDCTFQLADVTIKAHKLIMAMASPVFSKMLYGNLVKFPMPINNMRREIFDVLLEYIYSDNLNITSSKDACDLYYAAKKWQLPYVAKCSIKYLSEHMSPNNVCHIYKVACESEDKTLQMTCEKVFISRTKEVLKDESFYDIDVSIVKKLFSLIPLNINNELELFEAVVEYAHFHTQTMKTKNVFRRNNECSVTTYDEGPSPSKKSRYDLEDDENINDDGNQEESPSNASGCSLDSNQVSANELTPTKVVTELKDKEKYRDLVHSIRFLTLTPQEFAECATLSSLLTESEIFALAMNISSKETTYRMPKGFSTSMVPRTEATKEDRTRLAAVFRSIIHNFKNIQKYESIPFYLRNLAWTLMVIAHRNMEDYYVLGVTCFFEHGAPEWVKNTKVKVKFSTHKPVPNHLHKISLQVNESNPDYGAWVSKVKREDFLNPDYGFVDDFNTVTYKLYINTVSRPNVSPDAEELPSDPTSTEDSQNLVLRLPKIAQNESVAMSNQCVKNTVLSSLTIESQNLQPNSTKSNRNNLSQPKASSNVNQSEANVNQSEPCPSTALSPKKLCPKAAPSHSNPRLKVTHSHTSLCFNEFHFQAGPSLDANDGTKPAMTVTPVAESLSFPAVTSLTQARPSPTVTVEPQSRQFHSVTAEPKSRPIPAVTSLTQSRSIPTVTAVPQSRLSSTVTSLTQSHPSYPLTCLKPLHPSPTKTSLTQTRLSPTVTTLTQSHTSPTVTSLIKSRPSSTVTSLTRSCPSTTVTITHSLPSPTVTSLTQTRPSPTVTSLTQTSPSPTMTYKTQSHPSHPLTCLKPLHPYPTKTSLTQTRLSLTVTSLTQSHPSPTVTSLTKSCPSSTVTFLTQSRPPPTVTSLTQFYPSYTVTSLTQSCKSTTVTSLIPSPPYSTMASLTQSPPSLIVAAVPQSLKVAAVPQSPTVTAIPQSRTVTVVSESRIVTAVPQSRIVKVVSQSRPSPSLPQSLLRAVPLFRLTASMKASTRPNVAAIPQSQPPRLLTALPQARLFPSMKAVTQHRFSPTATTVPQSRPMSTVRNVLQYSKISPYLTTLSGVRVPSDAIRRLTRYGLTPYVLTRLAEMGLSSYGFSHLSELHLSPQEVSRLCLLQLSPNAIVCLNQTQLPSSRIARLCQSGLPILEVHRRLSHIGMSHAEIHRLLNKPRSTSANSSITAIDTTRPLSRGHGNVSIPSLPAPIESPLTSTPIQISRPNFAKNADPLTTFDESLGLNKHPAAPISQSTSPQLSRPSLVSTLTTLAIPNQTLGSKAPALPSLAALALSRTMDIPISESSSAGTGSLMSKTHLTSMTTPIQSITVDPPSTVSINEELLNLSQDIITLSVPSLPKTAKQTSNPLHADTLPWPTIHTCTVSDAIVSSLRSDSEFLEMFVKDKNKVTKTRVFQPKSLHAIVFAELEKPQKDDFSKSTHSNTDCGKKKAKNCAERRANISSIKTIRVFST